MCPMECNGSNLNTGNAATVKAGCRLSLHVSLSCKQYQIVNSICAIRCKSFINNSGEMAEWLKATVC